MHKPAREQGRYTQVADIALAHARACASRMKAAKPGTQAPSPASVRLDADERGEHSSSGLPDAVTPEEPALRAVAAAFSVAGWQPAFRPFRRQDTGVSFCLQD